MANRITPAGETPPPPSLSSPSLDLMKTYVQSKCCYHSSALTNAKVTYVEKERMAYQIDLWTLMEYRQVEKKQRPYKNESTPNEALHNEWDYNFQQPPTVLNKKQKIVHDLQQTRWKANCSECSGRRRVVCPSCSGRGGKACRSCAVKSLTDNGMYYKKTCSDCHDTGVVHCSRCRSTGITDCDHCGGRGQMLHWYQLTIEWSTIHSTSYQSNTPLPPKIIHKAPGKETYFSIDQKWSNAYSFANSLQSALVNQQTGLPVKLDELTEVFNKKHLEKIKKNCRIVQLKCEIEKLDITEVEYELDGYTNKRDTNMGNKFKFYYYGTGKKDEPLIYENDYPLNTCGCFGVGCAHYSKCCTIS